MTREETKEAIKVMQAFADGKKIQYYSEMHDMWKVINESNWNWEHIKYRIAPNQEEPKEKHYRPLEVELTISMKG